VTLQRKVALAVFGVILATSPAFAIVLPMGD
jgi:hypothetical protein